MLILTRPAKFRPELEAAAREAVRRIDDGKVPPFMESEDEGDVCLVVIDAKAWDELVQGKA